MIARWKAAALAACVAATAASAAHAATCDAVTAAEIRRIHTPNRSVFASGKDGKILFGWNAIDTADKRFLKITGFISSVKWEIKPRDPDKEDADYRKHLAASTIVCTQDGSETIGSETADIYAIASNDGKKTSTRHLWIGRSSGLPLKEVIDLDGGDAATDTWSYDDVTAPSDDAPPSPPRTEDCVRKAEAITRTHQTPHRERWRMSLIMGDVELPPGKTRLTIDTGDTIYEQQPDGSWKQHAATDDDHRPGKVSDNESCSAAGRDVVAGDPADIVAGHVVVANITIDTRIWISRKSGRELRLELKLIGNGHTVKSVSDFEFDDIHPPS